MARRGTGGLVPAPPHADRGHRRAEGIGPALADVPQTGVPVLHGLFCEVNAGVLATAIGAVAAHSATAYWDQAYAEPRRRVTPVEQHVHSLLEVSPIMATFLITALHWDQAKALAGQDRRPPQFGLRLKRRDPCPRLRA